MISQPVFFETTRSFFGLDCRCCAPFVLLRSIVVAMLWVHASGHSTAQLPTAELQGISRQVVQPGVSCDVSLQGSRLDELTQLTIQSLAGPNLNLTATPRLAPTQPLRDDQQTTTTFDLTIDASALIGLAEVRSVGRFGISNSRSVLVSPLPIDLPNPGIHNLVTAHLLKPGHLVNDKISERSSNFYRQEVKKGQRLKCSAYAKQLDSLAELNVRLLNQDGQLIISSRTNGNWPAELAWSNSTNVDQPVYVEVRDLLYRGGPNYNFVMEVQVEDPATTTPSIMHLDSMLRPTLTLPLQASKLSQPKGLSYAQRGWNDATPIPSVPIEQFPVRVVGDLLEPRVISFNAQKDQTLSFEIASAALDQLTDPAIVLYKVDPPQADGKPNLRQVAEQDDVAFLGTPAVRVRRADPQLVWKAPESASYQLHVIDRQTGERPEDSRRFLLEIRPAQPNFELLAHEQFPTNNLAISKPWGSQLQRNGALQVHVSVVRLDGFNEPIELRAEGLPAHCHASPTIVPSGAVEADVIILADSEIDGSLVNVEIVGTAKTGEQTLTSRAVVATVSSAAIPTRNAVVARSTASLSIQPGKLDTAPLQTHLGDGSLIEVKAGTKFNLPVKLIRQPGSTAECTLRPQALPPKVGLGEFKIAGDKSDASPEATVAADAPVGDFTFWVQTESKVKFRANPQQLEREEAYAAKLKSTLEANSTGDIPRPQVEAALTQANTRVEELKKSTAEQEYTVFVPSNQIRIRIQPKD